MVVWEYRIKVLPSDPRGLPQGPSLDLDTIMHSFHSRVPTAQGKEGKWPEKNCQGKHREFGNFAKTQGMLFAQVVRSLIP